MNFKKRDDQSKVYKHCSSEISSKIERIRSHLNRNNKYSASTRRSFVDFQLNDEPKTSATSAKREREIGVKKLQLKMGMISQCNGRNCAM